MRFKVGLDKNLDDLLAKVNFDGYLYGLVVTCLPKVTLRRVSYFRALCFRSSDRERQSTARPQLLGEQAIIDGLVRRDRYTRVVGDRSLDVPKSLRNQIATKLERAGVAPARTGSIKAFSPVGRAERSTLYGESLPPGLLLGSGQDAER